MVVGGRDTIMQSKDLDKRPHVVIATPGRLSDHIENNSTFSLARVKYLVMDEADRLLAGRVGKMFPTKCFWSRFIIPLETKARIKA